MGNQVAIITSLRGISLQTVSEHIAKVIMENSSYKAVIYGYPSVTPSFYKDADHIIVVMPFDSVHATTYFYLAWELKNRGKNVMFYTTIEGKPIIHNYSEWVRRDLTYIANSEYTKEKLEEADVKVEGVVYHGVDMREMRAFAWKGEMIRQMLGFKQDDFVVGYIANPTYRKGHHIFPEVIRRVGQKDPSIKFVVITDPSVRSYYEGLNNVLLETKFGGLTRDTIAGYYHGFDLYAQVALIEGFGMPVLEALAAGKMVVHADYKPLTEITTPDTSIRVPVLTKEYRKEGSGILFELHYYNPEDFANAIIEAKQKILTEGDQIKKRAKERAKEFDIRKTYKYFVDRIKK